MNSNIIVFSMTKEKSVKVMCTILEKIRGKSALELLSLYKIELSPPIDISLLVEQIGISLISKDFSEIEKKSNVDSGSILGAAVSKGNNLAIFYRKQDTYNRKKFTIAHELAHCCKHADNLKINHIELRTNCENSEDKHEYEANVFAGELLIPENVLLEVYKQFLMPSLKYLSELFCVSTNVMAARLDYLGLNYYKDVEITEE